MGEHITGGGRTGTTDLNGRKPKPQKLGAPPPDDDAILELAAQKAAHNMNDRYPCPCTDMTPDALILAVVQERPTGLSGRYYAVARRVNARALELAHTAGWAAKVKEKVCNACNELLPADYFGPHRLDRTGLQPRCRECDARLKRERRRELNRQQTAA